MHTHDTPPPLPVSFPLDLGTLSRGGAELILAPNEKERAEIAAWLDLADIEKFHAVVRLDRAGDTYIYRATLKADVGQSCVVTLERVPARHVLEMERRYHLPSKQKRRLQVEDAVVIPSGDDDTPELLSDTVLDLYGPILEELALALEPYPRKKGVSFDEPEEKADPRENPFAVLQKLKDRGPKDGS